MQPHHAVTLRRIQGRIDEQFTTATSVRKNSELNIQRVNNFQFSLTLHERGEINFFAACLSIV